MRPGGIIRLRRFGLGLVCIVCTAFAIRALALIDATGLWSDELYTVGKSFQPSYEALLAMLRLDTHPPLYYSLVWIWGQILPPSAITLRLFSWLVYLAGSLVITAQAGAIAVEAGLSRDRVRWVFAGAALMAFCSPYPVRFAIEGKGYALLVFLVALAWWWRQKQWWWAYGLMATLAGLTHYYGLFLFAATAVWDGSQKRWSAAAVGALAMVPGLAWMWQASAYLMRSGTGAWIGRPDFALLEDTLARVLGLWPFPKLVFLILVAGLLFRWGLVHPKVVLDPRQRSGFLALNRWGLADACGLIPSLLMVLGVVLVSFWKPLAFSRYFVVLLPALIPWLAVRLAALPLNTRGCTIVVGAAGLLVLSWWWHSFQDLDPAVNGHGAREADQFQAISRRLASEHHRFSRRDRLFNLSDRMEVAAGRMALPAHGWGGAFELDSLLATESLPQQLWLADSGDQEGVRPRLKPLQRRAEAVGYRCAPLVWPDPSLRPYAQVQECILAPSPSVDLHQ